MNQPTPAISLAILVVEDDELGGRTLGALLTAIGHEPDVVPNGRQALDRLENRRYDLIITDIYMPQMDGIELLRLLRRRPDCPPVIAISGGGFRVQVDYLDLARRLGAREILRKPFTRRGLTAAIESVMTAG